MPLNPVISNPVDIPRYWRDMEHQNRAINLIWSFLSETEKEQVTAIWRSPIEPQEDPSVISDRGLALIMEFEGCRLDAYLCPAGVWTIGYGHTRTARQGMRITQIEAQNLLAEDVKYFDDAVSQLVKAPLTQGQRDALVSFAFNVGAGALAQSTMLRLLNAGDYQGAAGQFDRWVYAGGVELPGLVRRRQAEKALFLS